MIKTRYRQSLSSGVLMLLTCVCSLLLMSACSAHTPGSAQTSQADTTDRATAAPVETGQDTARQTDDWLTQRPIDWGHRSHPEGRKIDVFIIHSMYNPEEADSFAVENCLKLLKRYDVSAHFIIDRAGGVHQLLPVDAVSWHAGRGKTPDGRTNINAFSLGVEVITSKHTPPTRAQYRALVRLTRWLEETYNFKYILRHSDISPARKTDPWNFDWEAYLQAVGRK